METYWAYWLTTWELAAIQTVYTTHTQREVTSQSLWPRYDHHFCGYDTIWCVEINGEDLSCYSNKTESVTLRKCPYDHWLTNKAYLSTITVTNISQSYQPTNWQQKSTGTDTEQNHVSVTLGILSHTSGNMTRDIRCSIRSSLVGNWISGICLATVWNQFTATTAR